MPLSGEHLPELLIVPMVRQAPTRVPQCLLVPPSAMSRTYKLVGAYGSLRTLANSKNVWPDLQFTVPWLASIHLQALGIHQGVFHP
jgi:hypothetical protein